MIKKMTINPTKNKYPPPAYPQPETFSYLINHSIINTIDRLLEKISIKIKIIFLLNINNIMKIST